MLDANASISDQTIDQTANQTNFNPSRAFTKPLSKFPNAYSLKLVDEQNNKHGSINVYNDNVGKAKLTVYPYDKLESKIKNYTEVSIESVKHIIESVEIRYK